MYRSCLQVCSVGPGAQEHAGAAEGEAKQSPVVVAHGACVPVLQLVTLSLLYSDLLFCAPGPLLHTCKKEPHMH